MIIWCEACGKREAWANNLKHPICAECAVLAWQKLSEDAESAQPSVQRTELCSPDMHETLDKNTAFRFCGYCGKPLSG